MEKTEDFEGGNSRRQMPHHRLRLRQSTTMPKPSQNKIMKAIKYILQALAVFAIFFMLYVLLIIGWSMGMPM